MKIKLSFFFIFALFSIHSALSQKSDHVEPDTSDNDTTYTVVDVMPIFGECEVEGDNKCSFANLTEFLRNKLHYPQTAMDAGLQGTVYVSFVVNKRGKVIDITVVKGVSGAEMLDEEALRIVNLFPDFSPGMQNGKRVKVKYTLPIRFALK